jgi:hypothetical protein
MNMDVALFYFVKISFNVLRNQVIDQLNFGGSSVCRSELRNNKCFF